MLKKDGWEANEFGEFIDAGYILSTKIMQKHGRRTSRAKAAELIGSLETDWFKKAE